MFSLQQYNALREGMGIVRRTDRGRLLLRGQDRLAYLHGLLTNDIASLKPGEGCYAALLTPQGRMISDMRVFETGEFTLVDLDHSLAPSVRDHFDKFIITEDVTVEDASRSLAQIGLYGGQISIFHFRNVIQPEVESRDLTPFVAVPADDLGVPGVDIVVPADRAREVEGALHALGAQGIDPEVVEVTRVEAGIPKFLVDMDTTTIPLEAGIEDRAISFTKGCYVGQEVIIRVTHRGGGRVAKKLVGLRLSAPVERDDRLFSGDREVGRITSAVHSPRFGPIALGYAQRDFTEPGTELRVQSNGAEITAKVTPTPF